MFHKYINTISQDWPSKEYTFEDNGLHIIILNFHLVLKTDYGTFFIVPTDKLPVYQ